jgi:hypothetical protein
MPWKPAPLPQPPLDQIAELCSGELAPPSVTSGVAEPAGRGDVISAVSATILTSDQMLCGALKLARCSMAIA